MHRYEPDGSHLWWVGVGNKIMDVCKVSDTEIGVIGTQPMFNKLYSPSLPFLSTHNMKLNLMLLEITN